uniref:Uncharacterized protein n=1 Tax=Ascaris lumbricoides TaxID=6252 RepID=A0A0M3IUS6_ASCLU
MLQPQLELHLDHFHLQTTLIGKDSMESRMKAIDGSVHSNRNELLLHTIH